MAPQCLWDKGWAPQLGSYAPECSSSLVSTASPTVPMATRSSDQSTPILETRCIQVTAPSGCSLCNHLAPPHSGFTAHWGHGTWCRQEAGWAPGRVGTAGVQVGVDMLPPSWGDTPRTPLIPGPEGKGHLEGQSLSWCHWEARVAEGQGGPGTRSSERSTRLDFLSFPTTVPPGEANGRVQAPSQ